MDQPRPADGQPTKVQSPQLGKACEVRQALIGHLERLSDGQFLQIGQPADEFQALVAEGQGILHGQRAQRVHGRQEFQTAVADRAAADAERLELFHASDQFHAAIADQVAALQVERAEVLQLADGQQPAVADVAVGQDQVFQPREFLEISCRRIGHARQTVQPQRVEVRQLRQRPHAGIRDADGVQRQAGQARQAGQRRHGGVGNPGTLQLQPQQVGQRSHLPDILVGQAGPQQVDGHQSPLLVEFHLAAPLPDTFQQGRERRRVARRITGKRVCRCLAQRHRRSRSRDLSRRLRRGLGNFWTRRADGVRSRRTARVDQQKPAGKPCVQPLTHPLVSSSKIRPQVLQRKKPGAGDRPGFERFVDPDAVRPCIGVRPA